MAKANKPKGVEVLLGFAGYYRRFVRDYSKIIKPLTDLTAGYPPLRKSSNKKQKDGGYFNPKEEFGDRWTPDCQSAFDSIIGKLTSAPVLGFANPSFPMCFIPMPVPPGSVQLYTRSRRADAGHSLCQQRIDQG